MKYRKYQINKWENVYDSLAYYLRSIPDVPANRRFIKHVVRIKIRLLLTKPLPGFYLFTEKQVSTMDYAWEIYTGEKRNAACR